MTLSAPGERLALSASPLEYPPQPETWEDAVTYAAQRRMAGDRTRWELGWGCQQVIERFGKEQLGRYAAEAGLPKATLLRYKWVASRFLPEHVNAFPGVPFSMWEVVTPLASDDLEAALDMIERAYDTPGITIETFKQIVLGSDGAGGSPIPPLHVTGRLVVFKPWTSRHKSPRIIVGIETDIEAETWERLITEHPLYGKDAALAVTPAALSKLPVV